MKRLLILIVAAGVLLSAGLASVSAQEHGMQGGRAGLRDLVEIAREQTGLNVREITQSLREGISLAELIQANGGNPQVLVDAAYQQALERIDSAEANGRITQERAAEMRANALEMIDQAVNGNLNSVMAEARLRAMAGRIVLDLAVEQTGLSQRELREALQNGATVADVLTENGVAFDAFIAEAAERANARLNVLVADGRLTAERAAELLGEFRGELTERLNEAVAVEDGA